MLHCPRHTQRTICHLPKIPLKPYQVKESHNPVQNKKYVLIVMARRMLIYTNDIMPQIDYFFQETAPTKCIQNYANQ